MPRKSYNTKQKQIILEYLMNNSGCHIKAADIHSDLAQKGINIGISTIYRYLDSLVNSGVLHKYILNGNDGACYQYDIGNEEEHMEYHLRCSECGELIHFTSDDLNRVSKELSNNGITVNLRNTVFSGVCESCKTK